MTRSILTRSPAAVAAVVGLALSLLAGDASAQELAGTWTLTVPSPRGELTMTLVVEEADGDLSGSVTLVPPRGDREPIETPISDGAATGASFTFVTMMPQRGGEALATFSGTVDGDEISGTISGERGERPFTGRRER